MNLNASGGRKDRASCRAEGRDCERRAFVLQQRDCEYLVR